MSRHLISRDPKMNLLKLYSKTLANYCTLVLFKETTCTLLPRHCRARRTQQFLRSIFSPRLTKTSSPSTSSSLPWPSSTGSPSALIADQIWRALPLYLLLSTRSDTRRDLVAQILINDRAPLLPRCWQHRRASTTEKSPWTILSLPQETTPTEPPSTPMNGKGKLIGRHGRCQVEEGGGEPFPSSSTNGSPRSMSRRYLPPSHRRPRPVCLTGDPCHCPRPQVPLRRPATVHSTMSGTIVPQSPQSFPLTLWSSSICKHKEDEAKVSGARPNPRSKKIQRWVSNPLNYACLVDAFWR